VRRHYTLNNGNIFSAQKDSTKEICQSLVRFNPCLTVHHVAVYLRHSRLTAEGLGLGFGFRHPAVIQSVADVSEDTVVLFFKINVVYGLLYSHTCLSTFRKTGLISSNHPLWRPTNRVYTKVAVELASLFVFGSHWHRSSACKPSMLISVCRSLSVPQIVCSCCSLSCLNSSIAHPSQFSIHYPFNAERLIKTSSIEPFKN
jgi:hypothetical protein